LKLSKDSIKHSQNKNPLFLAKLKEEGKEVKSQVFVSLLVTLYIGSIKERIKQIT